MGNERIEVEEEEEEKKEEERRRQKVPIIALSEWVRQMDRWKGEWKKSSCRSIIWSAVPYAFVLSI